MNKIGVYICNYNGKDFTIGCINSLYEQSVESFDICVVDNASTDGTVDAIVSKFPNVKIIANAENLGGAGGFDNGLKDGINKGYEYLVLLDNDVLLDKNLLLNMYEYMESHKDVGIVGAKVMIMDMPDTIQDYGDFLDFKKFKERNAYSMEKDTSDLPDVNECDYVPTCCVMVRRGALIDSGTMPADNFIYYDDIELSHKMKLKGWKVCALGCAKVWHKGGFRKAAVNTFSRYYFLRNRLNFFAKYINEEQVEIFVEQSLDEIFNLLYGFNAKNAKELFETIFYAYDDFIHGVRGKAADYKIMKLSNAPTPLDIAVSNANKVYINIDDIVDLKNEKEKLWIVHRMICEISRLNDNIKFYFSYKNSKINIVELQTQLRMLDEDVCIPDIYEWNKDECYDVVFEQCNHVSEVKDNILPNVYIDKYCNCITNENEYLYFVSMNQAREYFKKTYRKLMHNAILKVRANVIKE